MQMVNADVRTAEKQIAVESSAYFPRLTLQGNAGREDIDRETGSSGNFNPREISAQLTQLLTDFGATSARVKAASTVAEKEGFERNVQRQNLLLAAVEAQLKLIKARKAYAFAKESEVNIQRQTKLESARVEAGRGYATDVLQAKGQLAGAEARRTSAELQLTEALNRYKAVFGENSAPDDALQGIQLPDALMPEGGASLDEAVKQSNPDTLAALARQRVANADRRAQISRELMPRIDMLLSHSKAHEIDGVLGKKDNSRVLARLNWNFDLGMRATHLSDATQAAVDSATAKTDYVRIQASEEARSAWSNWQMSKQRADILDNQVQISASFLNLARRERELGRRSLLDILNGETALINARSDALEARVEEIIAAFRVLRASGRLEPGLFNQEGVITDATVWGAEPAVNQSPIAAQTTPIIAEAQPTPATPSTATDPARVKAFLEQWRTAWASANIDAYLAFYADNFQPANGLSREQWITQRRQRISKAGKIQIEIGDARITPENGSTVVEFLQRYRAANFADQTSKRLTLREEGGRLMIVQEIQLPQARPAPQTTPITAEAQPTPATPSTATDPARVKAFLEQWRAAWASANIDVYLASYADNFQPANGLSREQWLAQRRQRISKAGKIQIEIGDARSTPENGGIVVEFLQRYRAANFSDQVGKRLILREEAGRLMIVQEIQVPLSAGHP